MATTESAYVPAATLRLLPVGAHVLAFYDGRDSRIDIAAATAAGFDGGTLGLGIASYAIVSGREAIVYDTHVSVPHARKIRAEIEAMGVRDIRVVLSHWHYDHVAGNAVYADCEIIAQARTRDHLLAHKLEMEAGVGHPPIEPLVLPTTTYEGALELDVGGVPVVLRHVDIHSDDETMLLLPGERLMLAGDALEDPITYVAEPDGLERHLDELDRLAAFDYERILPCHGDPAVIAAGGYDRSLLRATQHYIRALLRCPTDPGLARLSLGAFIREPLEAGAVRYLDAYEAVHRDNVAAVVGRRRRDRP